MKKIFRLLFTIILILPLVTNARDLDTLKHRWTNEFAGRYRTVYENENSIGLRISDELYVLDKATGSAKKTNFSEGISAIAKYNEKYLNLTYKNNDDGSYTSTIYVLDENLDIENEYSITLQYEYLNSINIYNNEIILSSSQSGKYKLTNDYRIINTLTNSDGTEWRTKRMWSEYELYDSNGNVLKTISFANIVKFKNGYLSMKSEYSNGSYNTTFEYWDEKFETKIECNSFLTNYDYAYGNIQTVEGITYIFSHGSYIKIKDDLTYEEISDPFMTEEEKVEKEALYELREIIYNSLYEQGYELSIETMEKDDEGNFIVSAFINEEDDETQNYYYLAYYDSDYNLIFDKKAYYEETTEELRCRINFIASRFDEYIVFAYHNLNEENFIEFYDLDGNLVKKEQLDISYGGRVRELAVTKNGLLVIIHPGLGACESKNTPSSSSPTFLSAKVPNLMKSSISTIALYYEFPFEVQTKTDGNGTISSTHTIADSGENIEFTIQPKEGYKLDKVIVTDENGKKVTFTDYKFIMPSSNVTIEATFIVDNPNTSETLRSMVIIILTLIIFIIFVGNKNIKLFNKIDTSIS